MSLVTINVCPNVCPGELAALSAALAAGTSRLADAVAAAGVIVPPAPKGMPVNPVLQQLADQVAATTNVMQSAVTLINGIGQRVQDAVDQALANGETADQLKPVTDEIAALNQSSQQLAAAVQANTPAPPPSPPAPPAPPAP